MVSRGGESCAAFTIEDGKSFGDNGRYIKCKSLKNGSQGVVFVVMDNQDEQE